MNARRHVVITGGGKGIGAATAKAMRDHSVTLMGRDLAALQAVANEIGGRCIQLDVTDHAAVPRAFAQAIEEAGPVSILINNAGAATSASLEKTSLGLWHEMIAVNLTSAFLCAQQALPGMREGRWGRIVNLGSTASLKGYPYTAAYCAAKHGLLGFTRALALETARHGITVNAVCPGFTETDLLAGSIARIVETTGRTEDAARGELLKSNPQGRFIQPEEVADAVRWLCSESAGGVTGQAIAVAGGEVG